MNTSALLCAPSADAAFGPAVARECRDGFDFTLAFEQSIFVILPASLLLAAAPLRLFQLTRARVKLAHDRFRYVKLVALGAFASLQLALVALWATQPLVPRPLASVSLAAVCVSFASSVMCLFLSYAEHVRSPRPSSLLAVFLSVSLLLDGALLRSLWLSHVAGTPIRGVYTAAVTLKAGLVLLEAREKTGFVGREYSPAETASLYSRAVFAWVTPLLRTGFRRLLKPADLYELGEDMETARVESIFWRRWHAQTSKHPARPGKYHLVRCCVGTLKWSILAVVPPRLALLAFTICQPLALNRFLDFLNDPSEPVRYGYVLIGAYGLVYLGIAFSQALYAQRNARSFTMLRGLLVAAIFRKATKISITVTDNAAAVTLMSTDVEVAVRAVRDIHQYWANLVQIAIATWLLSRLLSWAAIGPIIVCGAALALTVTLAPLSKKTRMAWLRKTQERVGITAALLGHIKSIKMSGLGPQLSDIVANLRLAEILASRPFRNISAIASSVAQIPLLISPPVAFALFQSVTATTGRTMDATRMFAALSIIVLFAQPLFMMFEMVFAAAAALAAFERIQTFLLSETRTDTRMEFSNVPDRASSSQLPPESPTCVEMQNAGFAWLPDRRVLDNVKITIKNGDMAVLLGPVASGKTTLLKGLLGEVPHTTGIIHLATRSFSWCDQNPWIMNRTIRDNIIGYSAFQDDLYEQVVKACDLVQDFGQLERGDMTVVGSKGFALSGGQKQRISLARCVYARPRLALFDDVFSGLDSKTSKTVFENLFDGRNGLLRKWGVTVVLATQSVRFLSSVDLIIALRDGKILEIGDYEQLRHSGGYVESLLCHRAGTASNDTFEETESGRLEAKVAEQRYRVQDVRAGREDKRRQMGDTTVYRSYLGSMGTKFMIILFLLEIGWGFFQSFPTVWLKFWTDADGNNTGQQAGYYIGVYSALQILAVIWFAILIWFVFVLVVAKSGISLHLRLLSAVSKAPLSVFAAVDLGSITTRFSQDIGFVDNQLPLSLVISIATLFTVIAKCGLLAASSYYVATSFPFLAAMYYYLQQGYLRTSRQLRFLDLEEKAPLYTQFLETLAGLSTIRAFGWSDAAVAENHELVNRSQRPFFMLIMVQRWLEVVMELSTTALALLVVGFSVYLRDSVSVSMTGVSLVQLISMSEALSLLIQFWVQLETSLGAVARIGQFADETPQEDDPDEKAEPPLAWPSKGHVVIDNIRASYGDSGEVTAVDGVSLDIQPGEKIGICGRTGSGKSSLLLAILRLLDLSSGSIAIDSLPLDALPRETVRRRIITVSQDQFVLPGTVRQNLDPFSAYSERALLSALEAVGLGRAIEDQGGLEATFSEDMLSHGQKQLFFIARAVLRKDCGKLVLLDEATSSVDQDTEREVRKVVNAQFAEHTVMAIAHRLESVLDFDRVLVMEKGRVVETGRPVDLLQRNGGRFKALWHASRHHDGHSSST